jgi:hypothetical protein
MKNLCALYLFLPLAVYGQESPLPDLPADVSTWGEKEIFFSGIAAGFILGASSFVLRLIRQTARQNPEI